MTTRVSRFAIAALALAAPVASFAGNSSAQAMDACLQTFLTSDLAKDRKVTVEKGLDSTPRPLALATSYKIEVVVTGRESGKQLARVVCRVDSKGTIVAVNGNPTSAIARVAAAR